MVAIPGPNGPSDRRERREAVSHGILLAVSLVILALGSLALQRLAAVEVEVSAASELSRQTAKDLNRHITASNRANFALSRILVRMDERIKRALDHDASQRRGRAVD